MLRIYRLLLIFGTLGTLALLASCGPSSTFSSPQSSPVIQSTAIPHKRTPLPLPTPLLTPTATPQHRPITTTGAVTLEVNAAIYRPGDTIFVTLSNQTNQTIVFTDHLTNCTVILLLLQRQWSTEIINPCRLGILSGFHSLRSGESLTVKLVALPNGWPTGLYHAALTYTLSSLPRVSKTVFSADFAVIS